MRRLIRAESNTLMFYSLYTEEAPRSTKFLAILLMAALLLPPFAAFPSTAFAATTAIRQEINITDSYNYAASGAYATSSEIANLDSTKYNGATYYFEVVASTTSAVNATVSLVNATSSVAVTSVTVNGTSYARYRSTSFTAPGVATDYVVKLGNEAVGKGILAARIVILQSAASITSSETQVEIGNNETYTATATSTFSSPKYWLYDSSKWNGSPTFYAEVSYQAILGVGSSTTYSSAGTFTVNLPSGTASTSVGLWGGGGSGGTATTNPGGGTGGAGGQFASSTLVATTSSYTLVVGAGATAPATPNPGSQGASSTWSGALVAAQGGVGGGIDGAATSTGSSAGCIGTVCFRGGNGGAGKNTATQYGGGGGGGAGTSGVGGDATGAGVAGTGTSVGGGAGAIKNATSASAGTTGSQAGGGGSGGNAGGAADRAGGAGGAGKALITNYLATTTIAIQEDNGSFASWTDKAYIVVGSSAVYPGQPIRVRSTAFTPTTGRNYRIAFSSLDSRQKLQIFNAKVIVDQTNPTLLEPQYLVSNARLAVGTGLQGYLTSWNSAEWAGTTNTYIHEVDAGGSSGSVAEIDTSGGAQVTGSVVTNPDNRKQSSSMTMPSNGDIDVKATTNNNDVYSNRILVQVGPTPLVFSGTLYSMDETTAYTAASKTIKVAIGTSTPGVFTATTNTANGQWFATTTGFTAAALGQRILAWVSGDSAFPAATLTKASSTANSVPKIDLYRNRVTVKMEGFNGTTTTNGDFAFYDADNDPDIPFTGINGGLLNVKKGEELHIAPGTEFAPGGNVTLNGNASTTNPDGDFHLATGARQDGVATSSILTMAFNTLELAGNFFASSTSIFSDVPVRFVSTSTQQKNIIATTSTFNNIQFQGVAGSWTFGANAASTSGSFQIIAGAVTAPSSVLYVGSGFSRSGSFAHNSGTTTFSKSVGAISISNTMTGTNAFNNVEFRGGATKSFGNNSASTTNFYVDSSSAAVTVPPLITVSGNYSNNGTFTAATSTVYFDSASAQSIAGTLTGSSAFASTTFIGAGTKTFSNNASTTANFTINSGATVVAPSLLTISGNYTNNGTFTAGSGTVFFSGGSWAQTGSALSLGSIGNPVVAKLNSTDIAFIDSTNASLRTYRWNGSSWSQVGNSLSVSGSTAPSLTALSPTEVVLYSTTLGKGLCDYQFDGTNWTLTAACTAVSGSPIAAITALDSTHIAFVDQANLVLKTYVWNGSTFSTTGSTIALASFTNAYISALSSTDIAYIDATNKTLRDYHWDGSAWTLVGNTYNAALLPVSGQITVATLDSNNDVILQESGGPSIFNLHFDGTNWKAASGSSVSVGTGNKALVALDSTDVLFITSTTATLATYAESGQQTLSGTMNTAATGFNKVWFGGLSTKTLANNASTSDLTVDAGGVTLIAPALISVSGNYTNNSNFTANSGTLFLNGAAQQTLSGTLRGTSAFYNLNILNTSGTGATQSVIFSAAASTTNTFTMMASTSARFLANATSSFSSVAFNGTSAATRVWLRSSTPGTHYGFVATTSATVSYVDVQDASSCGDPQGFTISAANGTSFDSGNNCGWTFSNLVISGTLFAMNETTPFTGVSKTIKIAVGTSTPGVFTTTTNSGTGAWSLSNIAGIQSTFAGQRILAWVSGDSAFRAVTFTKASTTNNSITNLDLYRNRVAVKMEGFTGTSTTNTDLDFYDADQDSDIQYKVTAGVLNVMKSEELHIAPGAEFAPGGNITLHGNASTTNPDGDLHLAYGARQDGTATSSIFTLAANALQLAGNLFASSTTLFTQTPNTLYVWFISSSTQQKSIIATSSAFEYLSFNSPLGSWTFGPYAATTSVFDNSSGTVTAPSSTLTVAGEFYNSTLGAFVNNGGTVIFSGTSAQHVGIGNPSPYPFTGSNAFNKLIFRGAGAKSFASGFSSTTDFSIESTSGTVTAPSTALTIGGNYTNNGTFSSGTSTVYFDSAAAQSLSGTMTGASAFASTTFIGAGTKTFLNNASTTGNFSNGTSAVTQVVFITNTALSSWTVPSDWNNSNNTIEVIGGGGGGSTGNSGSAGGGGGGAGGAYAKASNVSLTPGGSVTISIGTGGSGGVSPTAGASTYFNGASCGGASACAVGGAPSTGTFTGGTGSSAGSVGDALSIYAGGSGASYSGSNFGAAGGGGAAGPSGAGKNGADNNNQRTGGGGGGGGGGSNGSGGSSTQGGTGGNSVLVAGGGIGGTSVTLNGADGTVGGGGGGGYGAGGANPVGHGGNGGPGTDWDSSDGAGGGGGGGGNAATAAAGGNGGNYGGGGGGGGDGGTTGGAGGSGAQGIIVITYTPSISNTTVVAPPLLTIGGNYTNNGTFSANSGTVYFSSTTAQSISGTLNTSATSFAGVSFIGSGTKTFLNSASTSAFSIDSGSAVVAPSSLTVSGNYTNNGTFSNNSGVTYFDSASSQTLSGVMTGTSAFASTTFVGAGTKTFSNNASTTSTFTINSGATVVAPSLLTIGGNYTQNGSFTDSGGTVYFSSTTAQTLYGTLNTATTDFANVQFLGSGAKLLGSSASTTNLTVGSGTTLSLGGAATTSTYTTAGTNSFVVPVGVASVTIKAWGAGGGSGSTGFSNYGGGGGFAQGTLTVTPGETLSIIVGGGGAQYFTAGTPGGGGDGGSTGDATFRPGGGGGRSEVSRGSTQLVVAGGGGGGGSVGAGGAGAGGGTTAQDASVGNGADGDQGRGGTQTAGGAAGVGASPGVKDTGGRGEDFLGAGNRGGGGGGGGYYGGGGGRGWSPAGAGGGGGSGYVVGTATGAINTTGAGSTTPNTTDVNYGGSAGVGGNNGAGQSGRVVISYTPVQLSIAGNYTNSGTLTAASSTVYLSGATQQTLSGTLKGASAFYNLNIINTSGSGGTSQSVIFAVAASTTNTFTMTASTSAQFLAAATSTFANINWSGGANATRIWLRSSTPTTPWGLIVTGTQTVDYVDAQDSYACAGSTIVPTNSFDSGRNTCWTFPAAPVTLSTTANQIFTIGDSSTAVSTLTITDGASPSITAVNKIRIAIATSTMHLLWDPSITTATFGGTASSKVANPVSYEGGNSVLLIPVNTNFGANDTLTISGVNLTSFSTPSVLAAGLKLFLGGASDQTADATNDHSIGIKGAFTPAEHTGSQVTNVFSSVFPGNFTNLSLYAFNLTLSGENITVSSLPITLSGVQGIAGGDITNAALFIDYNGNKVIDAGDTQVGGAGAVSISNQTGSIAFSSSFTATTTRNYILRADVANVAFSDSATLSILPSNITSSGVTSLITTTPSSTVSLSSIQHVLSIPGGLSIGGNAPAGQGIVSGGSQNGGGANGEEIGNDPGFFPPTTSGGVANAWTTPGNALVSDNVYATSGTNNQSQDYGGFGFSIPAGNTISGITVKIEASGTANKGTIAVALSWNGGTSITSSQSTGTLTSSDTVTTLGGSANTWGRSWAPSELSDANFKLRITGTPSGGNTLQVDAIQVNVYSVASGGGNGGGGQVLSHPRYQNFASAYEAALNAATVGNSLFNAILTKLTYVLAPF
jgi:hypothetical protein